MTFQINYEFHQEKMNGIYNESFLFRSSLSNTSKIFVKVGTNVRDDPMVKRHPISQIIIHPNYVPKTLNSDAALIRLQNPILLTNSVRIICLPSKNWSLKKLKSFKYCVIMGLGLLGESIIFLVNYSTKS